ncbi:MAG: ester cyclase [Candidatus Competibacteraceae bacterium]|nr:ester cyclase [Candidatus Competibacteraceae bacterium]MBK7985240.1 ester cyclase [Candidatus Competibacteraceae bacterium]MBK8895684.1 ester cyclase [Candidatus Competibacteraceae bacterium]MBK8962776.1 ester cyclase [Candidatus Competibacteraceae bacterium]MBK9953292.1 ester cyclase [Candidatus Competibacteraceae bacterium]
MTQTNLLEQNKRIVRRAIEEGWNPANLAVIDELYAADFLFHQESGEAARGLEAFKTWIATIHGAFPDIRYQIEAMHAEGDRVATRYTVRGTHTGDFRGLPPTGRSFNLSGHLIHRVADGKKTEGWGIWDTLGLMIQLGVIPPVRLGGPPPVDTAANIAATRRLFDALSSRDPSVLPAAIDDLMVPEFVTHGDALFPLVYGRDALRQAIPRFKAAFPDATATVQQIFAEGNKVVVHVRVNGTQEGDWMGAPATRQPMSWTASSIIRFNSAGQMAERWVIEDELGVMQQLGRVSRFSGQAG